MPLDVLKDVRSSFKDVQSWTFMARARVMGRVRAMVRTRVRTRARARATARFNFGHPLGLP